MNQPDPNRELRHLIRSAKEDVAALDSRFDRLEAVLRDQREDADQIRTALSEIQGQQRLHTVALDEILRHLRGGAQ